MRTPDEDPRAIDDALADGELTREECLDIVLGSHPRLEAEFHEIGVARADLARAGLLTNPAVSMFLLFPEGGGTTEIQGTIAASLADLWRIPARERAEQAELDRRFLETARCAGELALSAARAHDKALAARRGTELAREAAEIARRSEAQLTALVANGAGRSLDVEIAASERALADLAAASAESRSRSARGELFHALALPGDMGYVRIAG